MLVEGARKGQIFRQFRRFQRLWYNSKSVLEFIYSRIRSGIIICRFLTIKSDFFYEMFCPKYNIISKWCNKFSVKNSKIGKLGQCFCLASLFPPLSRYQLLRKAVTLCVWITVKWQNSGWKLDTPILSQSREAFHTQVMLWIVWWVGLKIELKQQLSVPAEENLNRAQGKPQTWTDISFVDQLKSGFLIGTSVSNKDTNTDSYCLNPQMSPVTFWNDMSAFSQSVAHLLPHLLFDVMLGTWWLGLLS